MIANTLRIDENALMREIKKSQNNAFPTTKTNNIEKIVKKNVPISEKAQKNLLSIFLVSDNHF